LIWPTHWVWTPLTAFIVCSGTRGRGDVVHKGLLRALGAALGTVVATEIAGAFGVQDKTAVVLIFAVLALASWLRPVSYAYWAGCVTAGLSLLYGYFGENAPALLHIRLEAILLGAGIGIAASWLILPVRTSDVVRRRLADALTVLAEILVPTRREPAALEELAVLLERHVVALERVASPLRAHRLLVRCVSSEPHQADAIDAMRHCVPAAHVLVHCASTDGKVLMGPPVADLEAKLLANVTRVRRAVGGRPGACYQPLATCVGANRGGCQIKLVAALLEIDAAMRELSGIFRSKKPANLP